MIGFSNTTVLVLSIRKAEQQIIIKSDVLHEMNESLLLPLQLYLLSLGVLLSITPTKRSLINMLELTWGQVCFLLKQCPFSMPKRNVGSDETADNNLMFESRLDRYSPHWSVLCRPGKAIHRHSATNISKDSFYYVPLLVLISLF